MILQNFVQDISLTATRIIANESIEGNRSLSTGFFIDVVVDMFNSSSTQLMIFHASLVKEPSEDMRFIRHYHEGGIEFDEIAQKHIPRNYWPDMQNHDFESIYGPLYEGVYPKTVVRHADLRSRDISNEWVYMFAADQELFCRVLSEDCILNALDPQLYLGQEVFSVGYPDNAFDSVNQLPVLSRAHVASDPQADFNGNPQFLIDSKVAPGANGSPVFTKLADGQYKLVGILAEPSPEGSQFGAVHKVCVLKELIALAVQKRIEENPSNCPFFDEFPPSLV